MVRNRHQGCPAARSKGDRCPFRPIPSTLSSAPAGRSDVSRGTSIGGGRTPAAEGIGRFPDPGFVNHQADHDGPVTVGHRQPLELCGSGASRRDDQNPSIGPTREIPPVPRGTFSQSVDRVIWTDPCRVTQGWALSGIRSGSFGTPLGRGSWRRLTGERLRCFTWNTRWLSPRSGRRGRHRTAR